MRQLQLESGESFEKKSKTVIQLYLFYLFIYFLLTVSVNANLILRLATVDALAVFSPSLSYI